MVLEQHLNRSIRHLTTGCRRIQRWHIIYKIYKKYIYKKVTHISHVRCAKTTCSQVNTHAYCLITHFCHVIFLSHVRYKNVYLLHFFPLGNSIQAVCVQLVLHLCVYCHKTMNMCQSSKSLFSTRKIYFTVTFSINIQFIALCVIYSMLDVLVWLTDEELTIKVCL